MRRTTYAALVLLVAAAGCGDAGEVAQQDDNTIDQTSTLPSTSKEEQVPTESVPPTDDVGDDAPADSTPPETTTPADEPATTLELNPPTTTKAPTAAGDTPVGSTSALYEGQIEPGLQPFVDMAIADLAPLVGAAESDISVLSAVVVTWSDSSLGCPQPDMAYAQVLQDGSVIELAHGARVYRYHSGGDRTPFLCDQPLTTPPVPGGGADV